MWGKLNLPIFLFNVGLLTLIKIDSLMYLAKPWPSLPPYYLKVVITSWMASTVAMMMYMGWILLMLFESFSKGPGGFPYVFIITGKATTLGPIYGPTLADHGVFVLRGDQLVLDGATTFEVGLYAIPPIDLFNAFAKILCIRYDNISLGFDFIGSGLGACSGPGC